MGAAPTIFTKRAWTPFSRSGAAWRPRFDLHCRGTSSAWYFNRFSTSARTGFVPLRPFCAGNIPCAATCIPLSSSRSPRRSGLIVPIGEWVLREACKAAAAWPGDISVAVNLSPVQFRKNRNLVEQVKAALSSSGLRADRLELEITETVLLADSDNALQILRQLKDLGVKIAMDDFGTGYSSLSYLRRFPSTRSRSTSRSCRNRRQVRTAWRSSRR